MRSWKVSPELFPCDLTESSMALAKEAVKKAVETWGERSLTALEAENRLAFACEKAPTDIEVYSKLREAFQVI